MDNCATKKCKGNGISFMKPVTEVLHYGMNHIKTSEYWRMTTTKSYESQCML